VLLPCRRHSFTLYPRRHPRALYPYERKQHRTVGCGKATVAGHARSIGFPDMQHFVQEADENSKAYCNSITIPLNDAVTKVKSQVLSKTPACCGTPLAESTSAGTPLSMHALDAQDSDPFLVPPVPALLPSQTLSTKLRTAALQKSSCSPCMDTELDAVLPEESSLIPSLSFGSDGCREPGTCVNRGPQPHAKIDAATSAGQPAHTAVQCLQIKRPLMLPEQNDNPTDWLSEIPTARLPVSERHGEASDLKLPTKHNADLFFLKNRVVRKSLCSVVLVAAVASARQISHGSRGKRLHRSDVEKVWPFG
jgi:hypothetical protein